MILLPLPQGRKIRSMVKVEGNGQHLQGFLSIQSHSALRYATGGIAMGPGVRLAWV